jgi:integrase/recombinase XerC
MDICSASAAFFGYLQFEKRYSKNTLDAYKNDLNQFISFLSSNFDIAQPNEVKPTYIRTWLASLKNEEMEARSINRKLSAVKSFYKYLLREGQVSENPTTTLNGPKLPRRLPSFATEGEMQKLLDPANFPNDWEGKTAHLAINLLYECGLRRAELMGLKESQVDAHTRTLRILGKGNKERLIPISQALLDQINIYKAEKLKHLEKPDNQFLLVIGSGKPLYAKWVYNTVVKYLGQAGTLSKRSPHVLRHTFATHLTNHGAELNAVKELLGHSSLAATQVYTHNTIEKLKDAYKLAHPKA